MSEQKSTVEPENNKFKKKSGTTNSGIEYEDLVVASLAIKLSTSDNIKNFQLSANNKNFEKLDDVVFEFDDGKKQKYVVQVKHKEHKTVMTAMLGNSSGDFSIQQYFESYQKITKCLAEDVNCVLFTNASYNMEENIEFELKNTDLKLKVKKCSLPETFLDTSGSKFVYNFELIGADSRYKKFLKHFYLYPSQKNVGALQTSLCRWFQDVFKCEESSFLLFQKYITDWSKRKSKKSCLNKKIVTTKIGEVILKPYMNTSATLDSDVDLQKLLKFCLAADIVATSSNIDFSSFNYVLNQEVAKLTNDLLLNPDEEKNKAVIAWYAKKAPLILRVHENNKVGIYKAIKLFESEEDKKKFLLITDSGIEKDEFEKFHVVQNLTDLKPDLYQEIVSEKLVSIQGRSPVYLKNVINGEAMTALTVDKLTTSDVLEIGDDKQKLPSPYINQIVSKMTVRSEFINDNFNNESLVVVSCNKKNNELKKIVRNRRIVTVEDFLQENTIIGNYFLYNILLVAENFCTPEEFTKICKKSYRKCHHILFNDAEKFEWLHSNGDITDLQRYFERTDLEESQIFQEKKNVNIISAKPGAGKSVMLSLLKNEISSDFWTVRVNFRDHVDFLKKPIKEDQPLQYFLDDQSNSLQYNKLTIEIRQTYVKKKKIVFLWDGFDELPDMCIQSAIQIIRLLSEAGFINWVTTRNFLQSFLESAFQTFSINIKEMDRCHQENYIRKQLNLEDDTQELQIIMKKITDIITMTGDVSFLGVPLRLYILTDLFLKNPEKYKKLLESDVTLPDIIKLFVEEKFNFCYKDKGNYNFDNGFLDRALNGNTKYRLFQYQLLALRTFLPNDIVSSFNINNVHLLEDVEQVKNDFGLITKIDTNLKTATFVHDIYGEYFVATWMVDNLDKKSHCFAFICEPKYKNIRIMFDLMLARDCPAHIAVIHKNFSSLVEHQNQINQTDKGGRSPLHLACSWGETHPLLEPEHKNGVYVLKSASEANTVKENSKDKDILEFLLKMKCDPLKKDELFQWNCIQYADNSLSLFVINLLLKHTKFLLENLRNFKDDISVSYYCIKCNYETLFDNIKQIQYVVDGQNENNLIHLAVFHRRDKLLNRLLTNSIFVKHIDDTNREKCLIQNPFFGQSLLFERRFNPLHLAAATENKNALCALLANGAKVNSRSSNEETPLHLSIKNKRRSSIKFLLQNGSDVNATDEYNNTALHLLCYLGDKKLINKALEKGAYICNNSGNMSPLDIAAITNRTVILNLLLKTPIVKDNTSILDYMTKTLYIAAAKGILGSIQCLVNHKVDLNRITHNHSTALMAAIFAGQAETVKFLLKNGADPNISPEPGINALTVAVIVQHFEIVQLLIQNNVNTSLSQINGFNNLMRAVCFPNEKITEILLKTGIDVNAKTNDDCTALHFAVRSGNTEAVRLLLDYKADANTKNRKGGTPLHVAAYYRKKNVYDLLIQYGADPNLEAEGITPLHLMTTPELTFPNNRFHVPSCDPSYTTSVQFVDVTLDFSTFFK